MPETSIDRWTNRETWRRLFDRRAGKLGSAIAANGYFSRRTFETTRRALLELIGPPAGRTILDIGCGNGCMLRSLTATERVVGVDLSPAMVALARDAGYVEVREGDTEDLPFADRSFDVVVSSGVLQLLPEARTALAEMVRVARPGGALVVATVNAESLLRKALRRKEYLREYAVAELGPLLAELGVGELDFVPLFFPARGTFRTPAPSWWTRVAMASFAVRGRVGAVSSGNGP